MYQPEAIKTGFLNLIGWRQNYDTSSYTIASSLTATETGRYYQDFHPMLTLDNIKAIAPEFTLITHPTWLIGTQYYAGDRVTLAGINYRAKINNIGLTPASNPNTWELFDAFSEWLENKTKASIIKAISSLWDAKIVKKTAKNLLESKALFNGAGRITDTIPNTSNLVGFEIVVARAGGVTAKIEQIGLQMTGTGTLHLYLMHSSKTDPVRTLTLTRTKSASIEWFSYEDLFLPYISELTDAGGSFYLVYDQTEMAANTAINKLKDWSQRPCTTCDADEHAAYNIWSQYLEIHPFKVATYDADPALTLWDIEDNLYTYSLNYGINLRVSIECDPTEAIIEQRRNFQNLIGLQVAKDMLREFAYNPAFRIGRTQQNFSNQEILYEIDGDSTSNKKSGLAYDYGIALEGASIDLTALSRVCFPCNNGGIKYRTA